MVGEIFAGLSAAKSAFDIAKGLKDIHDATIRNAAIIELQEKILAAQEAQATLLQQIRDLEKEIADLKAWEIEKQRYQMKELGAGAIAYVIKASAQGTDPVHCICAQCYERGKKSILQNSFHGAAAWTARWACPDPSCQSGIEIPDSTMIAAA
jgi:hypothetical protein